MNILKLFNFAGEKDFALELVQRLRRELPPSALEKQGKGITVNKITRVLERTYHVALAYQKEHRIGFVRRAVLANNFKWALRNNNYPVDFIDLATEGLVVSMTKRKVVEAGK
jgi:hypothetical protein